MRAVVAIALLMAAVSLVATVESIDVETEQAQRVQRQHRVRRHRRASAKAFVCGTELPTQAAWHAKFTGTEQANIPQVNVIYALLPAVAGGAVGAGQSPGWAGNLPRIEKAVGEFLAVNHPSCFTLSCFQSGPQKAFLDLEQCCQAYRTAVVTNMG
jgi:hypothetical protein